MWDIRKVVVAGKLARLNRRMVLFLEEAYTEARAMNATGCTMAGNLVGYTVRQQGCIGCTTITISTNIYQSSNRIYTKP